MSANIFNISDIVNAQISVLTELNEILDCEKEVLIKDKAGELVEIVEKKKLIAQKISLLERKRQEAYGSRSAEEFVSQGLLTKDQVDKIKRLAEDAREKGDTNLILTKQSIYYIRMITSALNPIQKTITYGNSGRIDDGTSSGMFTTKA